MIVSKYNLFTMYKKILNYVVLSMLTVFLYSCGSPKNVAYIQNSEETDYSTSEFR